MLSALVNYSDDSETEVEASDEPAKTIEPVLNPTKRKADESSHPTVVPKKLKALPQLEPTLFTPAPIDDPSKHQGRKRAIPYVEGQFVGHIYIPVKIEGELLSMLREVVQSARAANPAWHSFLDPEDTPTPPSKVLMHLSLSRPIPLRAHQRDDLRKEIRRTATQSKQFSASFSQLTTLTNDERTRTFLCAEVGAGHKELQDLSQSLSTHLTALRQLPYYAQPRFHISIAWILTPPTLPPLASSEPAINPVDEFLGRTTASVEKLQQTFSERLLTLGRLDIRNIEVKIGKEMHKWPLAS